MEIDDEVENSTAETDNTSVKRQMQKDDSGVCDEKSDSSCDESFKRKKMNDNEYKPGDGDCTNLPQTSESAKAEEPTEKGEGFSKSKSKFKNRNYRSHSQSKDKNSSEEETNDSPQNHSPETNTTSQCSPDSGIPEGSCSNGAIDDANSLNIGLNSKLLKSAEWLSQSQTKALSVDESSKDTDDKHRSSNSCSSDSSTSAMDDINYNDNDATNEESPGVLLKEKPKHKWFITPEIVNRQLGCSNWKQGPELFQQRMYGSLHSVQRLELMYKLEHHHGCVNSLNFNQSGTILASGSDDLKICLWDWALGKLMTSFDTGHKQNVFQAKFLPLSCGTHMVTCARDGQVRIVELASNGQLRATRKLAQHRGPAHRLAMQIETPHVFLSCGEDAVVMSIDVRMPKPEKVLCVKEDVKKIPLYSINSNPMNNQEFVVCGRDAYVRIYDQRNTSSPITKFCPQHLVGAETTPHVTSSVFNYNGTEVVASYNDEDIYLFDTRHSEGCDYVHRYQGHRNSATVKGVIFFGPKSEFIVSGSDCGYIFFWERETEAIVQWMAGDENGVVNYLEPHPQIPVLATSGLDEDVKIWVPSCETEPNLEGLKSTVIDNLKNRQGDRGGSDSFDGQMLWILWRHIRRTERMNVRGNSGDRNRQSSNSEAQEAQNSSTDSSSDSEEEVEGQSHRLQCSPS